MKIKTLLLIVITISLVSCTANNYTDKVSEEKSETTTEIIDEQSSAEPMIEDTGTFINNEYYNSARSELDVSYCDKITNEEQKKSCIEVVSSDIITVAALQKSDPSLCAEITNTDLSELCTEKVTKKKTEEETAVIELNASTTLSTQAIDQNDITICEQVPLENLKESCRLNYISFYKIIDETICEEYSSSEFYTSCIEMVETIKSIPAEL